MAGRWRRVPELHVPELFRRLIEIHRALDSAGFEHAVGGAIALGQYSLDSRATWDIDLNVIANPLRPKPLLDCLPAEIAIPRSAGASLQRDGQARLNWPNPPTPVDLFLPQHPTFHHLVAERAAPVDFFGDYIKVISATDLVIFKALFDRPKDWIDIATMHDADAADFEEAIQWVSDITGDQRRIDNLRAIMAEPRHYPGEEMDTFRWPGKQDRA